MPPQRPDSRFPQVQALRASSCPSVRLSVCLSVTNATLLCESYWLLIDIGLLSYDQVAGTTLEFSNRTQK